MDFSNIISKKKYISEDQSEQSDINREREREGNLNKEQIKKSLNLSSD